jgi:D-glycero-D-manno-heptose 1,7-bisphosphate phosphatase
VTLKRRALFLDWGGTLAVTRSNRTVVDLDGNPMLAPRVEDTLARVRPHFDLTFIVSNQARIGRGEISEKEVVRRFEWANERLGGPFDGWRICPHGDEDGCECRKPRPGMFLELVAAHDIDVEVSLHVGDSEKDRVAARAAGIPFAWAHEFFAARHGR